MYDKIIIGAGLYGLYAAELCGRRGEHVLVLEYDKEPFCRATYINQARVHMGYHYPRSFSTAIKSAHYFERFNEDYSFCIHKEFEQIYALSKEFSWTDSSQFQQFCRNAGIPCDEEASSRYFNPGMCSGTFLTREYTYDAMLLKEHLLEQLRKYPNVELRYSVRIAKIVQNNSHFDVQLGNRETFATDFLLNASYASTNQVLGKIEPATEQEKAVVAGYQSFNIKYELCEIILCKTNHKLENIGITVMDGPFFSIMPFGKTGYHSLTAVTFTPHVTSYTSLPSFFCQQQVGDYCSPEQLGNCNFCSAKPESAWIYMSSMARKYMRSEYEFEYVRSLFSMKPILQASEIDDSRPTVIRELSERPRLISVLSGKINTVYDLDEVLCK